MTTPAPISVEQKIRNKETVTRDELRSLQGSVSTLPKDALATLKTDLESYAAAKEEELRSSADTHTELLALQQSVEEERKRKMGTMESAGAAFGEKAGALTDAAVEKTREIGAVAMTEGSRLARETYAHAKNLTYREFAALQDPDKTTGEKALRVLGIMALMYGAYRAAKWVVGRPGSSFFGRLFRFLGVSALSVAAINYFGRNAQEKETGGAPAGTESTEETPAEEEPAEKPKDLLSALPDGKNLIDGTPRTFVLNGRNHTIAFTHRRIVLDGINYTLTSSGFALEISKAVRNGNALTLEAGAFGRKGTINASDAELTGVVRSLLSTGQYESETPEGEKVTIARS